MSQRRFFFQLFLLTVGMVVVILALQLILPALEQSMPFLLVSLLFFVLLNFGIYLVAAKAALSKDKNAFTRLIMVAMFVKMVLTAALVITYHQVFRPVSQWYLLPFFGIYVVFTIFETIFMTRLGKIKAH